MSAACSSSACIGVGDLDMLFSWLGDSMFLLLVRNLSFVFLAFAASAYVNVVPQLVYARTAPGTKSLSLSATLLIGTIACVAAVEWARRFGYGTRPKLLGSLITLALLAILNASSGITQPWNFAMLCVTLRALCQYASQETDRRAAALAGVAARGKNDTISLSMRFAGMLAGPLFVGQHPEFDRLSAGVYMGLAALALWSVVAVAKAPVVRATAISTEPSVDELPLDRSDRLLIWAARLCFACFAMLTACLMYVLRDIHGIADASRRCSLLITSAFGSAMLATPLLAMLRSRFFRQRTLSGMLPAPLGIIAAGLLMPLPSAGKIGHSIAGAVVLGVAFADFQLSFRDYASHQAIERGRRALLAVFNNLSNTSALIAFGVMLVLSVVARLLNANPAHSFSLGVAILGLCAFLVAVWARRTYLRAER